MSSPPWPPPPPPEPPACLPATLPAARPLGAAKHGALGHGEAGGHQLAEGAAGVPAPGPHEREERAPGLWRLPVGDRDHVPGDRIGGNRAAAEHLPGRAVCGRPNGEPQGHRAALPCVRHGGAHPRHFRPRLRLPLGRGLHTQHHTGTASGGDVLWCKWSHLQLHVRVHPPNQRPLQLHLWLLLPVPGAQHPVLHHRHPRHQHLPRPHRGRQLVARGQPHPAAAPGAAAGSRMGPRVPVPHRSPPHRQRQRGVSVPLRHRAGG
mmetsp:Transcript_20626/g.51959  ORF Transcript_20626/g.51959 Transcript_20626/m.51959 type:complete len:263 (+) Transcript_20626:378-1166(+)